MFMNRIIRSLALFGLGIGLIGLFTMGAGMTQFSSGLARMFMVPGVAGFLVLSGLGGYVAWKTGAIQKQQDAERRERALLQVIRTHSGKLTAFEVASETGMTLKAAEEALDSMVASGHGVTDLSEDMRKIYVFPASSPRAVDSPPSRVSTSFPQSSPPPPVPPVSKAREDERS